MKEEKKLLNILRWVLLLPASVLGSFIVYALFVLVGYILNMREYSYNTIWIHIDMWVANILAGAVYVLVGTMMAPKNKKVVMGIIVGILLIDIIITLIYNVVNQKWSNFISGICVLVGVVGGMYYLLKEGNME